MKQNNNRQAWTQNEDQILNTLVKKYGAGNWVLISQKMEIKINTNNRSGKQCRERWHNHLDPNISKKQWTLQEQKTMFQAHKKYGNKWSDIASHFQGRTDNDVKNHFYSTLRKSLRRLNKMLGQKKSTQKIKKIRPAILSKLFDDSQNPKSKQTSEALFNFILQRENMNVNNLSKKSRQILQNLTQQISSISDKKQQKQRTLRKNQQKIHIREKRIPRSKSALKKYESEQLKIDKIPLQKDKKKEKLTKTKKIKKIQNRNQTKRFQKSKELQKQNKIQLKNHLQHSNPEPSLNTLNQNKISISGGQNNSTSPWLEYLAQNVIDKQICNRGCSLRKQKSFQQRNLFSELMLPDLESVKRRSSSGLSEMRKLMSNNDFRSIYVTPRQPTPGSGYNQNLFQTWTFPQTRITKQSIDEETQNIKRQIQKNIHQKFY